MNNYEMVKEWRKNNPDKVLEQARRYRKKHPETNKRAKEKYRLNNLDKIRLSDKSSQAKRRNTDPEKEKLRREKWRQNKEIKLCKIAGRPRPTICEICNLDEFRIVFDHCHNKGHFRGWICDRCNRVLGIIKDDPILLRDLAFYLEKDYGKIDIKSEK